MGLMRMNEKIYSELFKNYVSNTNGKNLIANNIATLLLKEGYSNCLDIGGGNGKIAITLGKHLDKIVIVEPNKRLISDIKINKIANIQIVNKKIENYIPSQLFDVVLMSYFLDSFDTGHIKYLLNKIFPSIKKGGKIIGVTYLDGCDWDSFSCFVSKKLGIKRTGGLSRLLTKLRTIGLNLRVLKIVDTKIFGKNLDDLYKNLSFFAYEDFERYKKFKNDMISKLAYYANIKTQKAELSVKEIIYEIVPF